MTNIFRREKYTHIKGKFLRATILLIAVLFLLPSSIHANNETLKVGYTDSNGIAVADDGSCSGYVADYMAEISEYNGWEYEYIYDTWENNLKKLEQGELDFLVMMHYTEARAENFLFSSLPLADDYMALYAAEDSDFYYQDFDAMRGCRVGIPKQSIFEETFKTYNKENDLNCKTVSFETETEAHKALMQGKVDIITCSSFSHHSRIKLIDRFNLDQTYIVTSKENSALMRELDTAIHKTHIKNRTLNNDLLNQYYSPDPEVTNLYLTREEQEYIDTVDSIVIKTYDERKPMGYTAGDNTFSGILPDYMNMLSEMCGIKFIYEPAEFTSLEENAESMTENGYCMLLMDQNLEELSLNDKFFESDPLFETALGYVKQKDEKVSKYGAHTFALSSEMHHLEPLLLETNNASTITYYDTPNECMDAVLDGKAEMAILDEHITAHLLQKPKYAAQLVQIPGSGAYSNGICLYAPEEYQHLISILNKTLGHLDEEQRRYIISNSMLSHAYKYMPDDVLYEYGVLIMAIVVILLLLILLLIRANHYKAQKRENEIMQEKLQLDELTGIYHRTAFFDKAQKMVEEGGENLCIIRMNICRFKLINELYGSDKGDLLLHEIGSHLKELSSIKGFIAGHFAADRFYLCIDWNDFEAIGFEKRKAVPRLGTDISLIYGVYPIHLPTDLTVPEMCGRADMAIAFSQQNNSEYIYYYNDASLQKMLYQQEIESEMESALASGQFFIDIQPKYYVQTERIVGGEALVRWRHPQKDIIPPSDFIELFEKNGFILKLDRYVWEESCRLLAETKAKGYPIYPLSVNVSRVHFYSTELQDTLMRLVEKYGLSPEDLELEITESICSQEPEVIFSKCRELRQLGFKIAMDDFGSGFSSLNMLKNMPLDIIKMDLKFLSNDSDEMEKEKGRNILNALIELAHTLNIKVVVEGVETEEQKEFIHSIGNCTAQGYYYSKPTDRQSYMKMLL